jgi:hypothetical protein
LKIPENPAGKTLENLGIVSLKNPQKFLEISQMDQLKNSRKSSKI